MPGVAAAGVGAKHKFYISIKLRTAHLRTRPRSRLHGSVSPLFAATYTHAQPAPPSTRIARIALALHTPANLAASSGCCRRVCARLGLRRAALFGALSCSARVGGRNVPDAPRHPAASSRLDKAGRPRRHTPGAEQATLSTFADDIHSAPSPGGYKLGAIGGAGQPCIYAPLFRNYLVEAPRRLHGTRILPSLRRH